MNKYALTHKQYGSNPSFEFSLHVPKDVMSEVIELTKKRCLFPSHEESDVDEMISILKNECVYAWDERGCPAILPLTISAVYRLAEKRYRQFEPKPVTDSPINFVEEFLVSEYKRIWYTNNYGWLSNEVSISEEVLRNKISGRTNEELTHTMSYHEFTTVLDAIKAYSGDPVHRVLVNPVMEMRSAFMV